MGMPGMTNDSVAAYAATGNEAKAEKNITIKMTVAELRNKVNPTTHYYDNYSFIDVVKNKSIESKDKLAIIFGKGIVNAIFDEGDNTNIDMLTKLMKLIMDGYDINAKEIK